MNPFLVAAAAILALIAIVHSVLGELKILGPVLNTPFTFATPAQTVMARRTLRYAWHLASMLMAGVAAALLALAAGPIQTSTGVVLEALGGTLVWAALVSFTYTRGTHPGWPLFLAAGLCTVWAASQVGTAAMSATFRPAGLGAGGFLVGLGGLHFVWAVTGTGNLRFALPEAEGGGLLFRPGRGVTALVAMLFSLAGIIVMSVAIDGAPPALKGPFLLASRGIALVFGLRMIGDFKYLGLFKTRHETLFARLDTAIYSPLCALVSVMVAMAGFPPG